METNFHTHTTRCRHASGSDRAYVEQAIESGLKVLGFSDHSPYFFEGDYYSTFRMRPEEAEGYVDSILAMRREYQDDIDIRLGFETEYYPRFFEKLIRFYEQYPVDYIILGQHCLGNEVEGDYSGAPHYGNDSFMQYVNQVIEAMETGCFTYVAHPELFNFFGEQQYFEEAAHKLCDRAAQLSIPLEINLLGMRDGRNYPRRDFFEIAAQHGCDVIIGCDAHSPDMVCDRGSEKIALKWCEELKLHRIEYPVLRRPQLR